MLNKLLKTSFVLLLAITLTACTSGKKKETPGGDGEDSDSEIFYDKLSKFCDQNPQLASDKKYVCYYIKDKTEMDRNKAKPLYKHKINSDDQSPTTIRWDDSSFGKEFLPFTVKDSSTAGANFNLNFSVDKDSILDNETEYKYIVVSPEGNIIYSYDYDINKIFKVGKEDEYAASGGDYQFKGKKGVLVALFISTLHADKYLPFAFIDFK